VREPIAAGARLHSDAEIRAGKDRGILAEVDALQLPRIARIGIAKGEDAAERGRWSLCSW
jgi:hypothetical protein